MQQLESELLTERSQSATLLTEKEALSAEKKALSTQLAGIVSRLRPDLALLEADRGASAPAAGSTDAGKAAAEAQSLPEAEAKPGGAHRAAHARGDSAEAFAVPATPSKDSEAPRAKT